VVADVRREYHHPMSEPEPRRSEPDESTRFDKLMRALFQVDKRDVPKHEPKKRNSRSSALSDDQVSDDVFRNDV
jgi:hypothetical protein